MNLFLPFLTLKMHLAGWVAFYLFTFLPFYPEVHPC